MKRPRSQNDVFDCVELGKQLEPYAKLKTAPWIGRWQGTAKPAAAKAQIARGWRLTKSSCR